MKLKAAARRLAPVLFLFSLIKGLAWLLIPALIALSAGATP